MGTCVSLVCLVTVHNLRRDKGGAGRARGSDKPAQPRVVRAPTHRAQVTADWVTETWKTSGVLAQVGKHRDTSWLGRVLYAVWAVL